MVCAAADTVRTEVAAEVPEICKVAGLKLQLSPEGRPEQDRVTGPLKPPLPAIERFNVPGVPLLTVTLLVPEIDPLTTTVPAFTLVAPV